MANVNISLSYIVLFILKTGSVWSVYSAAKETEIRTEIFTGYDYISRPEATTAVNIGINILAIDELDLKSQKFSVAGWLTLEWEDPRLTWDKAAKDDIEFIYATPATIWKPEVVIDNSIEDLGVVEDDNLYLRISYIGQVEWEPPRLFTTHCQVDITYYPYDQQKCSINVMGWGYTVNDVKLGFIDNAINIDDFEKHGEWEISDTKMVASNITETRNGVEHIYPVLEYVMYIRRRTMFYDMNVVTPIILTSLLVALTFIVPVESGEKLSYILTVFLSLAVLLTITSDALPATSITTSILGLYLCLVTVLSAVAILLTVLLLLLYHRTGNPEPRSRLLRFARGLAKCTCVSAPNLQAPLPPTQKVVPMRDSSGKITMEDASDMDREIQSRHSEPTWIDVSIALDRSCFVLFLILTVAVNLSFLIALAAGGRANKPE